jgi:hypothetical protein
MAAAIKLNARTLFDMSNLHRLPADGTLAAYAENRSSLAREDRLHTQDDIDRRVPRSAGA